MAQVEKTQEQNLMSEINKAFNVSNFVDQVNYLSRSSFLLRLVTILFYLSCLIFCFAEDPRERQFGERDTDMETTDAGAKGCRASEKRIGGAARQGKRRETTESDSCLEEAAPRQKGQRRKKVRRFFLRDYRNSGFLCFYRKFKSAKMHKMSVI